VNISEHPVAENRTNTGLGFMFQEIEKSPHSVTDNFPSWGDISRSPQEDGVVSVPCECRGRNQPSSHARLKEFSIPLAVSPSYKLSRVCARDDIPDIPANKLKRLPVSSRRQASRFFRSAS